jgi:alkylation response protein AidB-like acyl-CoA dehydrogenase
MSTTALRFPPRTDEQAQLAEVVGQFFDDNATDPRAGAELGWAGIGVSEELGGSGGDIADLAFLAEGAGAALAATHVLWTAAILGQLLAEVDDSGARELLRLFADGQALPAVAIAGLAPSTSATAELSGTVIAFAPTDASHLALPASIGGREVLAIIPDPARRLGAESLPGSDVSRPLAQFSLDGFPITEAVVFGCPDVNRRWRELLWLMCALDAVGAARAVLDLTLDYAAQREQFGRPIGSFQAYKHRCASRFIELKLAQSLAFRAAARYGQPDGSGLIAAAARLAPAYATAIAGDSIQLHGGIGYTWEARIHEYVRRARVDELIVAGPDLSQAVLAPSRAPTAAL